MTDGQKKVIQYRLNRARETLEAAKLLLDVHHYLSAVNRLYYACYYAVSALLETRGLSSSKHSGVLSLFNKHFIKTGIIASKWGKIYRHLFDKRHEGDYVDFVDMMNDQTSELYQSAVKFVDEITRQIEQELK